MWNCEIQGAWDYFYEKLRFFVAWEQTLGRNGLRETNAGMQPWMGLKDLMIGCGIIACKQGSSVLYQGMIYFIAYALVQFHPLIKF